MRLELRDPATGHWVDADWQGDSPGSHALVIGVSRYAHLNGGDAPARGNDAWIRDCRGLGQLQVSALTAWRVFEWLGREYRHAGLPLVSCNLLLAPQEGELRIAPAMAASHAAPTLANCELAIREWAAGMKALPPAVAAQSRGLMFFSGHGIEVDAERQVLLPGDYLGGAMPSPDDALGTENIRQGLAMLGMSQVLLFIDACRNDSHSLRELDVRGRPTLPSGKAVLTNSLQTSAVLYATASGRAAFQHVRPEDGLSMYGAALLMGLRGQEDMEVSRQGPTREIRLFHLQPFVETQVGQLLRRIPGAGSAADVQAVSLAGRRLTNLKVTELPGNGLILMAPPMQAGRTLPWDQLPAGNDGPASHDPHAVVAAVPSAPALPVPPGGADGAAADTVLHPLLGSEDITALWLHDTRAYRVEGGVRTGPAALQLVHVERSADRERQRIGLRLDPGDATLVQLEQTDGSGRRWTCLVGAARAAGDAEALRLSVDATYRWPAPEEGAPGVRLAQWRVRLGHDNPGLLGLAAIAWTHVEGGRLDLAQHWVLRHLIEADVAVAQASPLAALVAGAVLLRADALAPHGDWLAAAQAHFPGIGDFAVMRAQAWLAVPTLDIDERLARACEALRVLEDALPLVTPDAFSRADVLLEQLLAQQLVPVAWRAALAAGHARLARQRPFFRAGGQFTVMTGPGPALASVLDATAEPAVPVMSAGQA